MSYKLKIRYIYLPDRFTVILLIHSFIQWVLARGVQCPSDSPFPLCRSCAILLRECMSIWHHSLMSSNHSLLGLPLRVRPSMIPNTTPFTSPPSCRYVQTGWASSPRWVVQCSSCSNSSSHLHICDFLMPVNVQDSPVALHFKRQQ